MKKLPLVHISLTLGLLFAVSILILSLMGQSGYGAAFIEMMASAYPGFDLSAKGTLLGMIFGFIDGFIAGALFCLIFDFVGRWLKK